MELDFDALQMAWRFIPVLVMVLTVLAQLANESRRRKRTANNDNSYQACLDSTIRSK